jgi:GH15 family glucan-1,4-alpha-glucosidase
VPTRHSETQHCPFSAAQARRWLKDLTPSHWGPRELHDYALLADGERGALIGPRGEISWMCFPTWDSDAIFSELMGGHGLYAVTPYGRYVWGGYYESGTLIWRSRWVTSAGIVESREALCMPASRERAVLLRRVVGIRGSGRVGVVLQPRSGYGSDPWRSLKREDNTWVGRTGSTWVRWVFGGDAAEMADGHRGRQLFTAFDFSPGSTHDIVLELSLDRPDAAPDNPDIQWAETENAWRKSVPEFHDVVGRRDVRNSYAVLRGLTSAGGGTVAAATTSLPERADKGTSYDYRYVWIRDQSYIGQALAVHGPDPLLEGAVSFVTDRVLEHGPDLSPAYTTAGAELPDQHRLNLPGYPGGTDVVGNHVNRQFQLDVFGEALLLLAAAARHDLLDARGWKAAATAAEAVAQRWNEPDAGIWELENRHWTESRLSAVSGLRAIAAAGAPAAYIADWTSLADTILAEASRSSVHSSGRWMRAPDVEGVDVSLLLGGLRGAISPSDPRHCLTLEAVLADLVQDGYAYRYRHGERPLGEAEGSFLLCNFMVSLALLQQGREIEAARWFERTRTTCGPPGLLTEEFDVHERQLRGNLPQAFVHGLLIETALRQSSEHQGAPSGTAEL